MAKGQFDFGSLRRLARFAAARRGEDRIAQVAGSLTFTTVLALVPLVTVAFALFTAFPIFSSFQGSLQQFLAHHLMPAQINSQIFLYLNQFAAKAKGLTTMGLVALTITAVMTMMTVESAFNVIWRVRKPRPFAQRVLVYWAVITLGPMLFGMSLSISSYLLSQSMIIPGARALLPGVIVWALASATLPLTALAFTMLYVYLPNCRVEWRDALVGGVLASVAFELAKRGFGLYIRHFPAYTAVYGAFAAIPIFLLWVYLSWFITLLGAMLVSALPAIRVGQFDRQHFAGSDLFDALELLARLVEVRDRREPGLTTYDLARMLRCGIDVVGSLTYQLESRGWIARLHEDGEARCFTLVINPEQVTLAELFDLLVVNRAELTRQLNRDSTRIDRAALLAALDNERLQVPLTALLALPAVRGAHGARAPRTDQGEPEAGSRRVAGV